MGFTKVHIDARISLPEDLATRVTAMSKEREMSLNALLSQLVQLGELSLRHEPTSAVDRM
jgi:hypothetical protein